MVIALHKCIRIEGDKAIRWINNNGYMDKDPKTVKTTINIDNDLWKKFSIKVIEEYGGRKKNDVIEELIKKYLKEKI